MCLSAVIWSNIQTVYSGNTREDADQIGFRDDHIYEYIHDLLEQKEDQNILKFQSMNREETIKTFNQFMEKEDKIIY